MVAMGVASLGGFIVVVEQLRFVLCGSILNRFNVAVTSDGQNPQGRHSKNCCHLEDCSTKSIRRTTLMRYRCS